VVAGQVGVGVAVAVVALVAHPLSAAGETAAQDVVPELLAQLGLGEMGVWAGAR
jgi:hypothetical protein